MISDGDDETTNDQFTNFPRGIRSNLDIKVNIFKIGSFYRPPWADNSYMEDLAQTLDQINPKNSGNIWVASDLNLSDIIWPDQ